MTVVVDHGEAVVTATIDDGKANALTTAVLGELRAALSLAVEREQPFVIAGRPDRFCAGFDLHVMQSGDAEAVTALVADGARLFRELLEAPVPVVIACTGHALAAGALLLLSADHRIGTRGSFKIGLNEVRIGLALPRFAVALAQHRLSPRHLGAATILAEVGPPEWAVEAGYLDRLADDAVADAAALAVDLAGLPGQPLAVTKRRVREPLVAELSRWA